MTLKIAFVHPASVVHVSRIFLIRLPFSPQRKNRPPVSRGSRVSRDARYYCLTNVLQSGPPWRRCSFMSREKNGHKSRRKVPLETSCPTLASIYHHPISLSLKYLNSIYIHYFPRYGLFFFLFFFFLLSWFLFLYEIGTTVVLADFELSNVTCDLDDARAETIRRGRVARNVDALIRLLL